MLVSGYLSTIVHGNIHLRASILYYLAFFLAGFLVCDLYLTRRAWNPSFRWDMLAFCGWPLVWYLEGNIGHVVLPFLIVALYLAAFRGRVCSTLFSNHIITNIGGMCYSIYLFHVLVISAVRHISTPWHIGRNFWAYYGLQALLVLPCVLVSCGAFFLFIERPCMDREWPRKLWQYWLDFVSSLSDNRARLGRASVHPK
jgi:peptidoglycan/LPS O-acetylase OafA/YrhL